MDNKVKKLAKILISLTEGKDEKEKNALMKNFLAVLSQKKKLHLARQILRELAREEKKKEVRLVLARKLGEKINDEIKEKLKEVFGNEKEFKVRIDEDLIGGFVAQSQSYLVDASIKGLINKLRTYG